MNLQGPQQRKTVALLVWAALFFFPSHHHLLAVYFIPTFLAFGRSHRHPLLVAVLNFCFGWTPAYFLVLIYALERPNQIIAPKIQNKVKQRLYEVTANAKTHLAPAKDKDGNVII